MLLLLKIAHFPGVGHRVGRPLVLVHPVHHGSFGAEQGAALAAGAGRVGQGGGRELLAGGVELVHLAHHRVVAGHYGFFGGGFLLLVVFGGRAGGQYGQQEEDRRQGPRQVELFHAAKVKQAAQSGSRRLLPGRRQQAGVHRAPPKNVLVAAARPGRDASVQLPKQRHVAFLVVPGRPAGKVANLALE